MSKGIGVYVGRNEVIAVSATRTATGSKILNYAIEPFASEGPAESDAGKDPSRNRKSTPEAMAIAAALAKINESGAYVNVALSPFEVVTRNFIMPAVSKKEEAGAIQFEASRYIPFKLSESVLDYYAYTTEKNVFSVTVTAIRRDILETYLGSLRGASVKVLMIEPVYCAVARAFRALNMIGKAKAYGFVFVQSDGNVNVTLAAHGIVYLSRDFILTGNADEDKERFYEETRASIDYFYKLTGGESVGQIFLAGSGTLGLWVEHLESSFKYTIRFDSARFPGDQSIPPEFQNAILVAYGLALRSLNSPSPLGNIKLLPKEERRSSLVQLLTFVGIECFAILALFVLVRVVFFQPLIYHLQKQEKNILEPVKKEDPKFDPELAESLKMAMEATRTRVQELKKFFDQKVPYSRLVIALGQGLPQSVSLDLVSFESTAEQVPGQEGKWKRKMSLRGICYLGDSAKESDNISSWVKALASKKTVADFFSEIKLEEIQREKFKDREVTRFLILGE